MLKHLTTLTLIGLVILASACGSDDNGDATATSPTAAAATATTTSGPLGIIAIGHSGLTGANADPERPRTDAPEYSWATGTDPGVNSIYQRLVALRPEYEGHVANRARNGAEAATLGIQAQGGLAEVPSPALVIIQSLDNDIRCDGTDAVHVPEVGASIEQALRYITQEAPEARILMLTQLGRPATYAPSVAAIPEARAAATSSDGACSLFDAAGNIDEQGIRELTALIEAYEAEQARVCAMFPQCAIADVRGFQDRLELFSNDYGHLAPAGHAAVAETVWPHVARLLGIVE